MEEKNERLVGYLKDEVGEGLRAVGRYDRERYHVLYARDDVVEEFDRDDIEEIHHEMVLKGLGYQHIESLFGDEELVCSIYQFETATRLHFVQGDYRGLYVSFDYDGDQNVSEIVDRCKDIVG